MEDEIRKLRELKSKLLKKGKILDEEFLRLLTDKNSKIHFQFQPNEMNFQSWLTKYRGLQRKYCHVIPYIRFIL